MPIFGYAGVGTVAAQGVAVVTSPTLQPPAAILIGHNPAYSGTDDFIPAARNCVVTHFNFDSKTAVNASLSLRDRIYFYVFGEKPATAVIKGLAFGLGSCQFDPFEPNRNPFSGFDSVFRYYEYWRMSSIRPLFTAMPLQIFFRTGRYDHSNLAYGPIQAGFPIQFHYETVDTSTHLGAFAITFLVLPRIDPATAIWW